MTKKWDDHKAIIVSLYREQNKPLHEVQMIMKRDYGFNASIRAYRSRFDKWEIHKYNCRKRSDTSDAQSCVSPTSPPEATEVVEPRLSLLTPPVSPGHSGRPSAPPTSWHSFEAAYPTPPMSVENVLASGLEVEGGRATGPARTSSISHSYRSDRGSPTALVTNGGQVHNFLHPSQGGDYFGPHGQFRSAVVDSSQHLNHPQDGMYGSAAVQRFSMLSTQVPTAPLGPQQGYPCY